MTNATAQPAWLGPLLAAVSLTPNRLYWFRRCITSVKGAQDWTNPADNERALRYLSDWLYHAYYTQGMPDATVRPNAPFGPDIRFAQGIAAALSVGLRIKPIYSPGFMMIHSGDTHTDKTRPEVRIYWNVAPQHAAEFAFQLTDLLCAKSWGFALKLLNNPDGYNRADTCVLYLRPGDPIEFDAVLHAAYCRVSKCLKPRTPAMTKVLGPGVALAESPDAEGTSFGVNRSAILAQGLMRGRFCKHDDWQGRCEQITEAFLEHGLDATQPFLSPGRVNTYHCVLKPSARKSQLRKSSSDPLIQLVRAYAESAIRHGDTCKWWGLEVAPSVSVGTHVSAPIGPDLYKGGAGIALLLAECAVARNSSEISDLAAAACRGVLQDLESGSINELEGFHSGPLGAVLCAAVVARQLGLEKELARGRRVALRLCRNAAERRNPCLDMVAGTAGTVAALLGLSKIFGEEPLRVLCVSLGQRLVQAAKLKLGAASWSSPRTARSAELTGFSHGAAGISCVLMELYAVTGTTAFLETALAGFLYERRCFDCRARNWPDYRMIYRLKSTEVRLPRTNTAWCHGASGIALARIHALRHVDDVALRDDARLALTALRRWMNEAPQVLDLDLGLCHGLAGNAAILSDAQSVGLDVAGDSALITEALARIEQQIDAAPQGLLVARPGMMTGTGGLGWVLAAASNPARLSMPLMPTVDAAPG